MATACETLHVRSLAALLICAAALTACGSHGSRHAGPAPPSNSRVERCVDRLVAGTNATPAERELVRRYTRDTYCNRFQQNGWIYRDGAPKLASQLWLQNGTCAEGVAGHGSQPTDQNPNDRLVKALARLFASEASEGARRLQPNGTVASGTREPSVIDMMQAKIGTFAQNKFTNAIQRSTISLTSPASSHASTRPATAHVYPLTMPARSV